MSDLPIVFDFLQSGYAYAWRYKDFHQGGNYSFGTQEQVKQAQELLNLPLMENWIDSNEPRTPNFQLTKSAKVANVIIKIYQVLAIPVLIASIAGILLMILGTVFAKADRAYYSSSLIVVTGLILTQLVFLSVSRGFVLMRQKKGLFFKCLHWRRRAINAIHRSNKHASFQ